MVAANARYGIGVGAGDAVLHPEARALAAEAKPTGAVVPAARDAGRREAPRLIALVGIDRRRVKIGEVARHRHLTGQPVPEQRRPRPRAMRGEEVLPPARVPDGGVQVTRRAGGTHVVLRHERDGGALRPGDFLDAVLVEHVAVGHLEGLGITEVDLLLPSSPLALRELDGHARRLHVVSDRADEPLLSRGLQDVIVLEVTRHGGEAVVALGARLVEGFLEEVELELRRRLDEEPLLLRALDLTAEHPARCLFDWLALLRVHVAEDERRLRQPRQEPPRGEVRDQLHVAVPALPRGELEPGQGLHLHVHGEEIDAGVHPVGEHVIEEIAAHDALAHEPAEAVGEHREHGIDVTPTDQRLESLRIDSLDLPPDHPRCHRADTPSACVRSAAILAGNRSRGKRRRAATRETRWAPVG